MPRYEDVFDRFSGELKKILPKDLLPYRKEETLTIMDTSGFIWGALHIDDQKRFVITTLNTEVLADMSEALTKAIQAHSDDDA